MPKTGATRYQKFLKSEKSKTKLKSKELPKGTNVTKTNFKVKKIVIREQLKTHADDEAITKKKLNLKELLSRLNHFNANFVTEGLNGIKELVSSHADILHLHLGQLIHGVTPLVLNVEKNVRRETLKVLHMILSSARDDNLAPFFEIMCTYLRCAMTHIDSRIQDDSLLFLDTLIVCTPDRVASHFYKIIPNFIEMISKLRADSKPGRTLTINLHSQMTSSKWRVKVLYRLQELLNQFVKLNKVTTQKTSAVHYYDEKLNNSFPLYDMNATDICSLPCLSSRSDRSGHVEDEVERLKKYLDTLLPLLFETWLEACPNINNKSDKNIETVVSEEAASLLQHLLEVINLLWEYVQILNERHHFSDVSKWFCNTFRKSYSQHLINMFPYSTVIRSNKDKHLPEALLPTIVDPKMINENLKICYLFIRLNPNVNLKEHKTETQAILNYVEKIFQKNKEENNTAIMVVLNALFSPESIVWNRHNIMQKLFEIVVNVYFTCGSSLRQHLFGLLCKISLDNQLSKFYKTESHEKWLSHLPEILCCETISANTINIVHKFATQNNKTFNDVVKPKLQSILKNLPNIKITEMQEKSYVKHLSLLYWINGWDDDCLNLLEGQLRENAYGNVRCKFIVDVLKLKSQKTQ